MKIALITEWKTHSGIAKHSENFAETLAELGQDVYVICMKGAERRENVFPVLKKKALRKTPIGQLWYETINFGGFYDSHKKMAEILDRIKPDIIHIQYEFAFYHTLFLPYVTAYAKKRRIPVVITAHSRHFDLVRKCLHRILFRDFDAVIVHTTEHEKELCGQLESDKIFKIPIPVPNLEPLKGRVFDTKTVLIFGLVSKYKCVDTIIRAFKRVLKKIPDARLIIAGMPLPGHERYYDGLEKLAKDLQIDGNVTFKRRWVPEAEVRRLFENSTVTIHAYSLTTQSASIQYSLVYGKPIICTSVGGLKEVVDKKGGFFVDLDEGKIAQRITSLISNPRLAKRMGDHNLNKAKNFTWKKAALKHLELYRRLAKR
ncbi:MAG: glycosyltransferase [Candidatus Aenigmatarchaeota archaeon]